MADRIYQYDRQEGTQMAWHGKTEVKDVITLDDNWLRKWNPVPAELTKRGNVSKWRILECSDLPDVEIGQPYNPLTFQPIDNTAFLELIRQTLAGTDHKITSVGSLRNRGRVFLSIELIGMEKFKAAGRNFGAYLNFGNGHDKSSVLWVNTSNTCTVCDNTFTCNLIQVENKEQKVDDDNLRVAQRHTKNVILRLPELAKLIDKAVGVQAEFQLEMDKLSEVACVSRTARELFAGFVGRKVTVEARKNGLSTRAFNTVGKLVELYQTGRGNRGETLADTFSAVTDYYSHSSSGGDNVMRQGMSSDYGAGNLAKQEFWGTVRDYDRRLSTCAIGTELLVNTKD